MIERLEALLQQASDAKGQATAVCDAQDCLTYFQLNEEANRLADHLQQLGVRRGSRVAVCFDRSVAGVVALFGCLKAASCYVPIDPRAADRRLSGLLEQAQCAAVLSSPVYAQRIARLLPGVPVLALSRSMDSSTLALTMVQAGQAVLYDKLDQKSATAAYILFTSGSTGKPKGVLIEHAAALAFVRWAASSCGLTASDIIAAQSPYHFDLSVFEVFASALAKAQQVIIPSALPAFPGALVRCLAEKKVTVWYSTPAPVLGMLGVQAFCQAECPSLRLLATAGETFPLEQLKLLRKRLPNARIFNWYGPTETNVCTSWELPADLNDLKHIPIGHAVAGDSVQVVDEWGKELAPGTVGELAIAGPTLMQGYWREEAQDHPCISCLTLDSQRVYFSRDMGYQRSDGTLCLTGRKDNMVKHRGVRVYLEEVEQVAAGSAGVLGTAALLLDAIDGSKQLILLIQPVDGETLDLSQIAKDCRGLLAPGALPDRIIPWGAFPLTSTGKLDRRALQEQFLRWSAE